MGVYHLRQNHLGLIAKACTKYSIRGGAGLIFTLFTMVTGLIIAAAFITPIDKMKEAGLGKDTHAIVDQFVQEYGKPAVKWAIDADDEQVSYLLVEKPAIVSAILVVLLFALPFLISLGAFNQLSGDISSKGLRYLLPRTERANLLVGRFIGTYLFSLVVLAVLMAVVLVYMVLKGGFYPASDIAFWVLRGYVALAIYALPYVALCSWLSSAIDSPFGSLVLSQLVIGLVPVFVGIGAMQLKQFKYVGYVMPWPLKYELLHPSGLHFIGATVAMVGYTAAFLAIGLRSFQKRDL